MKTRCSRVNVGVVVLVALVFFISPWVVYERLSLNSWRHSRGAAENGSNIADTGLFEMVQGAEKVNEVPIAIPDPVTQLKAIKTDASKDLVLPDAHAWLVLDGESGEVLGGSNYDERRQIASLTKMMTAVLVMEKIKNLDEAVTIDEETPYVEGTRVGCPRSGFCPSQRLVPGEKISARNLLKAMLMNSANDAALALGKHIAGSQEAFVELMIKRAKEIGAKDSHFCTPSGLEFEGREAECYSTAYDIGRIAVHSMRYPEIWEIMRLAPMTISSIDGKYTHSILNTDQLLDQPNILGAKTGFTPLAGRSLMLGATDPEEMHSVIAVLLDDPYRWQDVKIAVQWAFDSYSWK